MPAKWAKELLTEGQAQHSEMKSQPTYVKVLVMAWQYVTFPGLSRFPFFSKKNVKIWKFPVKKNWGKPRNVTFLQVINGLLMYVTECCVWKSIVGPVSSPIAHFARITAHGGMQYNVLQFRVHNKMLAWLGLDILQVGYVNLRFQFLISAWY